MKLLYYSLIFVLLAVGTATAQRAEPDLIEAGDGDVTVQPVRHGSLVLSWNNFTVYVDPVGGAEAFGGLERPEMILITHTHGDHMDPETLAAISDKNPRIVVPQSVRTELPADFENQLIVLPNGEDTDRPGLELPVRITAVPMYNLPEGPDSRHPKGWGNGYLVDMGDKTFYISGDTEDIPEMRSLEGVDVAFVCMNLPYTMDVNQAADAVLDFQPDIVYPYHHRGQDIEQFKKLVNEGDGDIEVRLKEWYPDN